MTPVAPPQTRVCPVTRAIEWPTWLVVFLVHATWLALLIHYQTLAAALAAPLLALTLTWHSSICHEILHGHPTRIIWLNDLLAQLPLALLVPYFTYKETHLRHHRNDHITLPGLDPESFFADPVAWRNQSAIAHALARVNMTLVGRLVLGPGSAFARQLAQLVRDFRARRRQRMRLYLIHFTLACAIVILAQRWFQVPIWQYLLIAYASHSLLLVRSYFEHRPHPVVAQRSVIMESCLPLRLLYLNNNYHAVHHDHPGMPWYQLPREFRRGRTRYLERNGDFHYRGYRAWLKYWFKPVAAPMHPFATMQEQEPNRTRQP